MSHFKQCRGSTEFSTDLKEYFEINGQGDATLSILWDGAMAVKRGK